MFSPIFEWCKFKAPVEYHGNWECSISMLTEFLFSQQNGDLGYIQMD